MGILYRYSSRAEGRGSKLKSARNTDLESKESCKLILNAPARRQRMSVHNDIYKSSKPLAMSLDNQTAPKPGYGEVKLVFSFVYSSKITSSFVGIEILDAPVVIARLLVSTHSAYQPDLAYRLRRGCPAVTERKIEPLSQSSSACSRP